MRLNKFIAAATGVSRREADELIASRKVKIREKIAHIGAQIDENEDEIFLNGEKIFLPQEKTLLILNKPRGFVASRAAQGKNARTLYELLPKQYQKLKTVGRLDKDSSGLILLTDDGDFAFSLTHPKFQKTKIYLVALDRDLAPLHQQMISDFGVKLSDGNSRFSLEKLDENSRKSWRVMMYEGRNRQIRRTFAALGYEVKKLHRTNFGKFSLETTKPGEWRKVDF